jgi:signal transduction histidine kinase
MSETKSEKFIKDIQARNKDLRAKITSLKREKATLEKDHIKMLSLLEHLQESKEQERTLVVHRIYNELGTQLTALKMDLNLMSEEMSNKVLEITKFRDASNRHIDMAIHELRKLSDELRPPILDQLGLAAAIDWQAGLFKKQTGLSCRVKIDPENLEVGRKVSIGLFRILQGVLENVTLHAHARSIQIGLKKDKENLVLTVQDDGVGICQDKLSNSKSLGLIGMHERAKSLSGIMTVRGRKRGGTRVVVKIPLKKSAGRE